MITSTLAVAPAARANVVILRLRSPGMIEAHKRPLTTVKASISQMGNCGSSSRKSLKPMATNCLSSTATQKIGSEKNKNEMKVTV